MNVLVKVIILLVLVISGIGKIIDPVPAVQLMEKLPLIPNFMIIPVISVMPVLELAVAIGMIVRYKKIFTYSLNLFLFFGFFIISIHATMLKITDDCGCFGSLVESRVGWPMVLRNAIFLGMAIYLFIVNNKEFLNKLIKRAGNDKTA